MAARRRLDAELVRRELAPSRELARRWIAEHQVTVNGAPAAKPATMVAPGDAVVVLAPPPRYVGRGGEKMQGALESFGVDPTGLRCLDVGSSTGGFTDCLLQHGAATVIAVDVGRAQLHERLRRDDRVDVLEQTDIRVVTSDRIGGPVDLCVIDVSFIGLDQILDYVLRLVANDGRILALVKPQFEAGREEADRGKGIIRDPAIWRRVLVEAFVAVQRRGWSVHGVTVSPIRGGASRGTGNVEFFLDIGGPGSGLADIGAPTRSGAGTAAIDAAVAAAGQLP